MLLPTLTTVASCCPTLKLCNLQLPSLPDSAAHPCSCAPFALLFKIVACISNILQTWPCTATPEQGLDTRTGVQSFVTIALGLSKLPDLHEMHAIIYPDISAEQYK